MNSRRYTHKYRKMKDKKISSHHLTQQERACVSLMQESHFNEYYEEKDSFLHLSDLPSLNLVELSPSLNTSKKIQKTNKSFNVRTSQKEYPQIIEKTNKNIKTNKTSHTSQEKTKVKWVKQVDNHGKLQLPLTQYLLFDERTQMISKVNSRNPNQYEKKIKNLMRNRYANNICPSTKRSNSLKISSGSSFLP